MTFRRYILASFAAMLMAASVSAHAQPNSAAFRSGYAPVNGLRMYYEIHGTGQPLILVHGGLGSSDMFAPIVPELSKTRQVITVDLQAHGRTADIDRPLSFETMAEDIAALIQFSHDFRVLNGRSKRDFASNRVTRHVGFLESQIMNGSSRGRRSKLTG